MKEVIEAVKYLYQSGIIDDTQFQYYYNMCSDPNINFEVLKSDLRKIYDNYKSGNKSDSFDFDIIDVDDGDEAELTGVIPINMVFSSLNDNNVEGQTKGKKKVLNAHPGVHWGEDSGFMTLILVMFLAGISSGIIFMIILNFFAK